MPPNSKVFIRTNVTIHKGGAGLTMKSNGPDYCGFFIWSQTTLFLAADDPEEQSQGSIASFTYGEKILLEAELDGTQLKIWINSNKIFDGNHPQCDFNGTGKVGTLHHSGSQTTFHDFLVKWG
jgi:hypothetical protein